MTRPPIILLAGPTGSGKTAAALALAERLGAEIVGADSMQIYRDLPVLTAQPTAQEQALAKKLRQAGGRFTRTNPWVELQEVRSSLQPGTVLIEFARFRRFDFNSMRADQPGGAPCFAAWIIPADLQQPVRTAR